MKSLPCGIIDIFFRNSCNPILLMFMSSIKIVPVGSDSLNRAVISEDFPAPVRPTIPILSLASVLKLIFFRMILEFSSYLNDTSRNSTTPVAKDTEKKYNLQKYIFSPQIFPEISLILCSPGRMICLCPFMNVSFTVC